jgi:hypothetical protein
MAIGMETDCVLYEVQTEFYVFLHEIIFKINQKINQSFSALTSSHYFSLFYCLNFNNAFIRRTSGLSLGIFQRVSFFIRLPK